MPAGQDDYAIDDPDTIFSIGCYTKFESIFMSHLKLIAVTTLVIVLILVSRVHSSYYKQENLNLNGGSIPKSPIMLKKLGVYSTNVGYLLQVLGVLSSCALTRIYTNQDTPYYSLYS
jgi:hypothetical protein